MRANNNIEGNDLENEKEEEMTNGRKKTKPKTLYKPRMYKPKFYKPKMYKPHNYNPKKTFPKSLKIKVPKNPSTLNTKDVDRAVEIVFGKKKKG